MTAGDLSLRCELNGLFYDIDGPIAMITINDRTNFYTLEGLKWLIDSYGDEYDTSMLQAIYLKQEASRHLNLPDISMDDISGQQHLFE